MKRSILCAAVLACGLGAQAAIEVAARADRPPLRQPLETLPMRLGPWQGTDKEVDPLIRAKSQCDECLSRVYEDTRQPGRTLELWMNYSRQGLNMRHSPEVCLPSGGWEKVESRCKEMAIDRAEPAGKPLRVSRLVYSQGELVHGVGFWYYIFGEGRVERFVRGLPITSRSSHGRTTRGSGLTVQVFAPGDVDPDGQALADFAASLLGGLDPILPAERAEYFIP